MQNVILVTQDVVLLPWRASRTERSSSLVLVHVWHSTSVARRFRDELEFVRPTSSSDLHEHCPFVFSACYMPSGISTCPAWWILEVFRHCLWVPTRLSSLDIMLYSQFHSIIEMWFYPRSPTVSVNLCSESVLMIYRLRYAHIRTVYSGQSTTDTPYSA